MLAVMHILLPQRVSRRRRGSLSAVVAALTATVLATACMVMGGAYGPDRTIVPGAAEGDVTRVMGPPTSRYVLPGGGSRLEYARIIENRTPYLRPALEVVR